MNQKLQGILLVLILSFSLGACATELQISGADLTGSEWWVEDIDGKGVIDMSHTTLSFYKKGAVAGDTGCNRYNGSVEIDGKNITFGPVVGTRKACARSLMVQEMKFYQATEKVVFWEVADTGLLHLISAEGKTLIRAWRIEE